VKKYFEYDCYYTVEHGEYAFYSNENGTPVLRFRTKQVAVAYDHESLQFYKQGEPSEVMAWAARQRASLREAGDLKLAECLSVSTLPRQHDAFEFTLLANQPHQYIRTFLQKAGLI
jgi:hypothetical protein